MNASDPKFSTNSFNVGAASLVLQDPPTPGPTPEPSGLSYGGIPVGTILQFAGIWEAPYGWLPCDGSLVSRDEYAELFAAYGEFYGSGDGAATFGLPDCGGRALVSAGSADGLVWRQLGEAYGADYHRLTVAEMPLHAHAMGGALNLQFLRRYQGGGNVQGPSSGTGANWAGSVYQGDYAGGDQPFALAQPSLAVQFLIWSGVGSGVIGPGFGSGMEATPAPEVMVYSTVTRGEESQPVGLSYTVDAGQIGIMILLFAIFVVLLLRAVTDLMGWRRGS